ncbi:TonB family protein [Marinoscillum pacificum]|uniref:TonB family protein n=1 Tax=Marinoscillum pacificum TaxID=392723 RepID=UPI00215821B9|nr:TonB family protein [Marinoscillum pacificum]
MINYVIELTVIHLSLIAGYWFFLRNERQYSKMRSFLLGSTLLAIVVPFLKLPKLIGNFWSSPTIEEPISTVTLEVVEMTPIQEGPIFDLSLLIYPSLVISLFFLYQFISSLYYLLKLERNSQSVAYEEFNVRKSDEITGSFTFFNWIFVGKNVFEDINEYTAILKHEKAHADLGHTYDLLFFQLFRMLFWWLPSAWYINKEIKKIHEYQADAFALKAFNIDWYSSILISSTLKSNGLSLASSFHDGLILKRLKAMKQNAKKVSPWKLGALLSLSAVLFVVFACSEELDQEIKKVGEASDAITFDQLPADMQMNLVEVKDQLTFIKATVSEDQKISNIKELQELDPSLIHAINVDKENRAVYIAVKKDGANFNYVAEKSKMDGEVFTLVEEQPEYPGGMPAFYQYLGQNLDYPLQARQMGVEGRVYVQFIVEKDGSVSEVKAVKGIGAGCDAEAERVMQGIENFKPGTQRGKPVRVRMVLPIIFKLGDELNEDESNQGIIVIEEVETQNEQFKIDGKFEDGIWSGTVYSADSGKPLPGVNIVEDGTSTGTVSNLEGKFKLKVTDESHDLVLSFIGYETKKLTAGAN